MLTAIFDQNVETIAFLAGYVIGVPAQVDKCTCHELLARGE